MLWDRGEADGYAQHMTRDPYPNTPPHKVLLHVAFGDHQVANVADRGRGADDRRARCARRRSTPAAAPTCSPSGASRGCGAARRRAAARSSSGTSARCGRRAAAPAARRRAGHAAPPVGEHAAAVGRRPARHHRARPARRSSSSRLPGPGGRFVDVCGTQSLLRRRVDGTDAMRRAPRSLARPRWPCCSPSRPRGGRAPHRARAATRSAARDCLFPWPNDYFTRADPTRRPAAGWR